jgi:hypothetical protein
MTVDIGISTALATFRQLIPCFRSDGFVAPDNPPLHLCEGGEQVHEELGHGAVRARVD